MIVEQCAHVAGCRRWGISIGAGDGRGELSSWIAAAPDPTQAKDGFSPRGHKADKNRAPAVVTGTRRTGRPHGVGGGE